MEVMKYLKYVRVVIEDMCCMIDLIGDDLVSFENIGRNYFYDFLDRGEISGKSDKDCMMDFVWWELGEMEEIYVVYLFMENVKVRQKLQIMKQI